MARKEVSLDRIANYVQHCIECEEKRQLIRANFSDLPEFDFASKNNGAGALALEIQDIRRRYEELKPKYFPIGVTAAEQLRIDEFIRFYDNEVAPIVNKTQMLDDELNALNPYIRQLGGQCVHAKLGDRPEMLKQLFRQLETDMYFGFSRAEIAAAFRSHPALNSYFGAHIDAIHPLAGAAHAAASRTTHVPPPSEATDKANNKAKNIVELVRNKPVTSAAIVAAVLGVAAFALNEMNKGKEANERLKEV